MIDSHFQEDQSWISKSSRVLDILKINKNYAGIFRVRKFLEDNITVYKK